MKAYVLAIDPSGAFLEGKGTTGWCLMDTATKALMKRGAIHAKEYDSDVAYWKIHTTLISWAHQRHPGELAVVVEDYLLYADKADAQICSRFETSQLIGILKLHCADLCLPLFIQAAGEVAHRWDNKVLIAKKILVKKGCYRLAATDEKINRHELDALRHAMHFSYFYNK